MRGNDAGARVNVPLPVHPAQPRGGGGGNGKQYVAVQHALGQRVTRTEILAGSCQCPARADAVRGSMHACSMCATHAETLTGGCQCLAACR